MPSDSRVIDQNVQNIVLLNNSRTALPTKVLMPFLSFSNKFASECLNYFQYSADNFESAHKSLV